MLSPFPELFAWSWYVPLFFRLFLAIYLLHLCYHFAKRGGAGEADGHTNFAIGGGLLVIIGLSFFVGLYVQISGAIGFVLALTALLMKPPAPEKLHGSRAFYFLLGLVSLSLVFLGAGPYAFDLPL